MKLKPFSILPLLFLFPVAEAAESPSYHVWASTESHRDPALSGTQIFEQAKASFWRDADRFAHVNAHLAVLPDDFSTDDTPGATVQVIVALLSRDAAGEAEIADFLKKHQGESFVGGALSFSEAESVSVQLMTQLFPSASSRPFYQRTEWVSFASLTPFYSFMFDLGQALRSGDRQTAVSLVQGAFSPAGSKRFADLFAHAGEAKLDASPLFLLKNGKTVFVPFFGPVAETTPGLN